MRATSNSIPVFSFALLMFFVLNCSFAGDVEKSFDLAKLRNSKTKAAELKRILLMGDEFVEEDALEGFEDYVGSVIVLAAAQPAKPDASLLLWRYRDRSYQPGHYRLSHEDLKSRHEKVNSKNTWKVGDPWMEDYRMMLLDEGIDLSENSGFLDSGVIADFNGDGLLDVFSVRRLVIEENLKKNAAGSARELVADYAVVRPLDHSECVLGVWICNVQPLSSPRKRELFFDIRKAKTGKGLDIAFVPDDDGEDVVFSWNSKEKKFHSIKGDYPDSVSLLDDADIEEGAALTDYVSVILGLKSPTFIESSVSPGEVRKNGYGTRSSADKDNRELVLPEKITELSPTDAAMKTVDLNRDDYHRELYDLSFDGKTRKPKSGWVSVDVDFGKEDEAMKLVWWLPEEGYAHCWKFFPNGEGRVVEAEFPGEMAAWWMEWLFALDHVRTIPKSKHSASQRHLRGNRENTSIIEMQVAMIQPELQEVKYEGSPSLWGAMRGAYDREAASAIAIAVGNTPQGLVLEGKFVERDLKERSKEWLKVDNIENVPPVLSRLAILSIGRQGWQENRELLKKLQESLGGLSEDEKEINKLADVLSAESGQKGYPYWFYSGNDEESVKFQEMDRRIRKLKSKNVGDPRYELRDTISVALRMLDCYENKEALDVWAKEKTKGSDWAAERLKKI